MKFQREFLASWNINEVKGYLRGRVGVVGVRTLPPPPEITCGLLIQLVFCKKKLCGLLVLK